LRRDLAEQVVTALGDPQFRDDDDDRDHQGADSDDAVPGQPRARRATEEHGAARRGPDHADLV